MMKNICCSFDNEHGMVYMTCNNGVHPDKNGHHSRTIVMSREDFLKGCENRELFNEPLGIDIRLGWQNALKNAISNCKGLKTDIAPEVAAKDIIDINIAQRGEDAVRADMEELEKNNTTIQDELQQIVDKATEEGKTNDTANTGKTKSAKGGKKSRGATADTASDETSANGDSKSE